MKKAAGKSKARTVEPPEPKKGKKKGKKSAELMKFDEFVDAYDNLNTQIEETKILGAKEESADELFVVDTSNGTTINQNTNEPFPQSRRLATSMPAKLGPEKPKPTKQKPIQVEPSIDNSNPLLRIYKVCEQLSDKSGPITFLLRGKETLSDLFFMMLQEQNKIPFPNVKHVVLLGCIHITDISLGIIAQIFPALQTIDLSGCCKITETGLYQIVSSCPDLSRVDLPGTDVAVLPYKMATIDVNNSGFPCVSPDIKAMKSAGVKNIMSSGGYKKPAGEDLMKMCIIHGGDVGSQSLLKHMKKEKDIVLDPMVFAANFKLSSRFTANVVECHETMCDIFITKRVLYIFTVTQKEDATKAAERIFGLMCHIINKTNKAVFLLAGMAEGSGSAGNVTAVKDKIQSMAMDVSLSMKKKNLEESDALKKGTKNVLGPLQQLRKKILLQKALDTLSVDTMTIDMSSPFKEMSAVEKNLEKVCSVYPEYQDMAAPTMQILRSNTIDKMLENGVASMQKSHAAQQKLADMFALVGRAVCLVVGQDMKILCQIDWLVKVINIACKPPEDSVNNGRIAEIQDNLRVWTSQELAEKLKKVMTPTQAENGPQILHQLGLSFSKAVFPFKELPAVPENPVNDYFPELDPKYRLSLDIYNAGIKVEFFTPAPSLIFHQLLTLRLRMRRPTFVWQTGCITLDGLVETLIEMKTEGGKSTLAVYTHTMKKLYDETFAIECVTNTLLEYKILIDFILYDNNIPHTVTYTGKQDVSSPKLICMHNPVVHKDDEGNVRGQKACKWCGQPSSASVLFWELHLRSLMPEEIRNSEILELEGIADENSKEIKREGNVITFNKCESPVMIGFDHRLVPLEENTFRVTLLNNPAVLRIGIGYSYSHIAKKAIGYFWLNIAKKTLVHCESGSANTGEVVASLTDAQVPQHGDTVVFKLSDAPEDGLAKLQVLKNTELLTTVMVPLRAYLGVIQKIQPDQEAMVMFFQQKNMSISTVTEIQVGMRLEALDRKTPNLICVASITQVYEDGKVLVHFDGWTNHYDYVAEPGSADLHPIGWFNAHDGTAVTQRYNQRLQAPNGYRKEFTWKTYLEEGPYLPVPYTWFNEAQIGKATSDLEEQLMGEKQTVTGGAEDKLCRPCRSVKHIARKYEFSALKKVVMDRELFEFFSNHSSYFCLLPSQLTLSKLKYPSLLTVMRASQQSVHILCPGMKMEVLHFVDHEGVQLTKTDSMAEMAQYLQYCYRGLLFQDDLLPRNCTKIIKGITWDQSEGYYETWMQRLCFLYLTILEPLVQMKEMSKIPKIALDVFTETMADKKLSMMFSGSDRFTMCSAHSFSVMANSDMSQIPMDKIIQMYRVINNLDYSNNKVEELPDDLFDKFISLELFNMSHNFLKKIPAGLGKLEFLNHVDISSNQIEAIPDDLDGLKDCLEYLNISNNPLKVFPKVVFKLTNLKELQAENVGKVEEKDFKEVKNLTQLEVLNLGKNSIDAIPDELGNLPLVSLDLSGVPWVPMTQFQSYRAFSQALNTNCVTAQLTEQERLALFQRADVDESSTLTQDEVTILNYEHLLKKYPRFGLGKQSFEKTGGIPPLIFRLKSLKKLVLQYHAIESVPDDIQSLTSLKSINLSCNPNMVIISAHMGKLPLKQIGLQQCPALNTPPKEVVARGNMAIMGYLKRLLLGASPCKRTKLMLVGLGGAGKTSLSHSLMNSRYRASMDHDEPITDGIDISKWQIPIKGNKDDLLTFSVWDFAGQTVYYNTHQFFLSNRAVYLLLWNVRQGYEHAGLDFWLSSIACHAPKAPIIVVGTHVDKVEKFRLPEANLQARFPQISGFSYVSSYAGTGIDDLRKTVIDHALKQKYMGEKIPEAWLTLEKVLIEKHKTDQVDILPLKKLEAVSNSCGIFDRTELIQAIQFLHDLGAVQFFNTDFLRDMVVIYPQWIIDVMACLVTVHQGSVKKGKLLQGDVCKVWSDYPVELHPWLLRLTEEFDLTCPLMKEDASIVPCLLPDEEPEFSWPQVDPQRNIHESMIMYKFIYLPAGLFNRAQVRLNHYSEGALLWKKGSYLKKNQHIALMLQTDDQEVVIRAQGFRPENFLYLVHEMFETLIAESYAGVRYDFLMPCIDCLNMNIKDPSMVSYNKVQRGLELNVPFLQCEKFFHILSMQDIIESMPSNRLSDMDNHLRHSVRELIDLTEGVSVGCFFVYTGKNIPTTAKEEETLVSPTTVLHDLQEEGSFNVSYSDKPETLDMEALTLSLKSSDVIIIGMSDEFCDNEECKKLLMYVKDVLRKAVLLLLLGTTMRWQTGPLSMTFGTEVYVTMQDKKRYPHKIKELFDAIKKKAAVGQRVKKDLPKCFISYCWSNSHDAISKGSRKIEGALGWEGSDPRVVKNFLQEKGVDCWIDVERVGGSGLFHSIADGLREAEIMVAFVSDEYVRSKNCVMEFRYALSSLRVPVVIVVVGTGYEWERSEVGLLTVGNKCEKVNLQYQNEAGYLQILSLVQKHMGPDQSSKEKSIDEQKNTAFQEVLELTQRKFLRHMTTAIVSHDAEPYPNLIVVDFLADHEKEAMAKTLKEKMIEKIRQQRAAEKEKEKEEEGEKREGEKRETEKELTRDGKEPEIFVEEVKFPSRYCFRIMCENAEGWHLTDTWVPFPDFDQAEEKQVIDSAAPYLSRVYAIAKHSHIELECLITPEGQVFQQRIEEIGMRSASDFRNEYETLRQMMIEEDNKFSSKHHLPLLKNSLSRCHVNGKYLWLCDNHKQASRSKTEKKFQGQFTEAEASIPLPSGDVPVEAIVQEPVQEEREVMNSSVKPAQRKIFKKTSSSASKSQLNRQTSQMCSMM